MRALPILPLLAALAACHSGGGGAQDATARHSPGEPSAAPIVAQDETLHFTGTEPFWGGTATGDTLTYSTPENQDGTKIPVERFAGNNGVSFTGTMDGRRFDMTVSQVECSDGMSDRRYPFTVTLQIGEDTRGGCGWTDRRGFEGPERP
jgi:uncharacterized membrane protein